MTTATSSAGDLTGDPVARHRRAAGRRCTGFTLLEILVVLAIASLLLTLVPLAFSGSVDLVRSKGAARDVAATLQAARSHAVARNRIVNVTFDAESGRYQTDAGGNTRHLPKGVRLSLIEAQKAEDGSDRGRIRFFPDGSSSGGQLLVEDGTRRFRIAVDWLLGRVAITRSESS